MSEERVVVGIDLGTTNSLVCTYKDNNVVLIPNRFGSLLTPSVVGVDEQMNIYTGRAAKERMVSHPSMTVASFKRFMGTEKRIKLGNYTFSPEELSAFILRDLINDAEKFLGKKVDEAVISVPAYFNDDSRTATKNAGIIAGIHVERVINEPSAAALAAKALHSKDDCTMLVVDLGGGTLDVSLVECFGDIVSVLAVSGDNYLGGDDFDTLLAKHFCKVNNINYLNLSEENKNIIHKNAENCKIALSSQDMVVMAVKTTQIEGYLQITKSEFVKICNELLLRIQAPIKKVFVDSGLSADEVDDIVLVGGGCKIDIVRKFISHTLKRKTLSIGETDQIVACGVGVYAGIKSRNDDIKQLILTDICPFSLGVAVHNPNGEDSLFSTIIERNTALPVSRTGIYSPVNDSQHSMTMRIFQGENMYVKDNLHLGDLQVNFPNIQNKSVEVRLTYDLNGILQVDAIIEETGERMSKTILSKTGKTLTDEQLAQKLKDLEQYKKKNQIEEQITFLINTAEGLYAQTTGDTRNYITKMIDSFSFNVGRTNSLRKKTEIMKNFWDNITQLKAMVDYDPFENVAEDSMSWFDEFDDEDYE